MGYSKAAEALITIRLYILLLAQDIVSDSSADEDSGGVVSPQESSSTGTPSNVIVTNTGVISAMGTG